MYQTCPKFKLSLHNPWNEATIEVLYILIGHLRTIDSEIHLRLRQAQFLLNTLSKRQNADCLITYAQGQLQFIGIFALKINSNPILKEDEKKTSLLSQLYLKLQMLVIMKLYKLRGDVDHSRQNCTYGR